MKAAPPKAAEAVVGFLIPPACREYVLGDLHERYMCPRQYLADAVCTVPLVIASRIRRTMDPKLLLMEAFALYISFLAAAWYLDGMSFLQEQRGLLRLAIPTVTTLGALILEDAYASPGRPSPLTPILDAAFGVGFAFLSQAALSIASQGWSVPLWTMISGGGLGGLLVATLRVLFPADENRPRGAT